MDVLLVIKTGICIVTLPIKCNVKKPYVSSSHIAFMSIVDKLSSSYPECFVSIHLYSYVTRHTCTCRKRPLSLSGETLYACIIKFILHASAFHM